MQNVYLSNWSTDKKQKFNILHSGANECIRIFFILLNIINIDYGNRFSKESLYNLFETISTL